MFGRHIISCVQRSLDSHSCSFACEQQATLQITCFCNTRISSNVELCICRIYCKWARKTDFCYYHWTRPKSFKRPTKVNIVLLKFWYNDKTTLQSLHNALMHRVHTGASQHARGGQRMVWVRSTNNTSLHSFHCSRYFARMPKIELIEWKKTLPKYFLTNVLLQWYPVSSFHSLIVPSPADRSIQ